jgi:HlyD family secretion protein
MTRVAMIAAVFMALAGVLYWQMTRQKTEAGAVFLGYVEGETLYLGPVEGERLARLDVDIGAHVEAGAPLFALSTELLERQRAEAAARLVQLEAQTGNLRASLSRPQQVAVLHAALARAEAALTLSRADYERQRVLFAEKHIAKAALDRAAMARARDEAAVDEARRQIEAAELTGRAQEIDAAQAAVAQARAARDALDIRIARQTLRAPVAGVVQDVFFRPGEAINAGQPVVALLPPDNRKLRFYAPQATLAGLRAGDRLAVSCDGCPPDLSARISFIASREEYTPPVIFSDAERAKLVFRAEARLEGAARDLPLGLPVRVRHTPASEAGAAP